MEPCEEMCDPAAAGAPDESAGEDCRAAAEPSRKMLRLTDGDSVRAHAAAIDPVTAAAPPSQSPSPVLSLPPSTAPGPDAPREPSDAAPLSDGQTRAQRDDALIEAAMSALRLDGALAAVTLATAEARRAKRAAIAERRAFVRRAVSRLFVAYGLEFDPQWNGSRPAECNDDNGISTADIGPDAQFSRGKFFDVLLCDTANKLLALRPSRGARRHMTQRAGLIPKEGLWNKRFDRVGNGVAVYRIDFDAIFAHLMGDVSDDDADWMRSCPIAFVDFANSETVWAFQHSSCLSLLVDA